jgi:hypothetical protein
MQEQHALGLLGKRKTRFATLFFDIHLTPLLLLTLGILNSPRLKHKQFSSAKIPERRVILFGTQAKYYE